MPSPICLRCRVEMRCVENDCLMHDPKVGMFPETYNFGDRFECPCCESEIVTGFGRDLPNFGRNINDVLRSAARPYVHDKKDIRLLEQYDTVTK